MVTWLEGTDAAFYYLDTTETPAHVGSLAVLRSPKSGLDYEELLGLVDSRLARVPRYRQKVREVASGFLRPVWVDDPDFDLTYHVRRSALPRPGTPQQLGELVARLASRPLDRSRPLWEMYLVEGLAGDRFALFTKSHQAIVDPTAGALEIGQVILDTTRKPPPAEEELWMPRPAPTGPALALDTAAQLITRPRAAVDLVRSAMGDLTGALGRAAHIAEGLGSLLHSATTAAPQSPLNAPVTRNRRFAVAAAPLDDFRKVRARYGCTVNDVVLAVVAGALRNWLIARGEPVLAASTVRALVPIPLYPERPDAETEDGHVTSPGELESVLVDLPVGELNPVVRLSQIAHAMSVQASGSRLVAAQTMVRLSGFAPPTMHAMGARLASSVSRRAFNMVVTNAPGPQRPMYVAGAKLLEIYPVAPLLPHHALSIGLTSYDGRVFCGVNGDRDAMPDVELFPDLLRESLDELVDASGPGNGRGGR